MYSFSSGMVPKSTGTNVTQIYETNAGLQKKKVLLQYGKFSKVKVVLNQCHG